jgi:DNA excision repair protein ERCC-4
MGNCSVHEIPLPMSIKMTLIQTCLLDLLNATLSELRRAYPDLPEDTVSDPFAIRLDLSSLLSGDVSWRMKQLIGDMRTLKKLLFGLVILDALEFQESLSIAVNSQLDEPTWIAMDAAEVLVATARQRAGGNKQRNPHSNPEMNPKWKALLDILDEINKENEEPKEILILVKNTAMKLQIKRIIEEGISEYLKCQADAVSVVQIGETASNFKTKSGSSKRYKHSSMLIDKQMSVISAVYSGKLDSLEQISSYKGRKNASIYISTLKDTDYHYIQQIFPSHIVLFQPELQTIRAVELFKSKTQNEVLQVYFLIYKESSEEQLYLGGVRREKEAFERLIKTKAEMALCKKQDEEIISIRKSKESKGLNPRYCVICANSETNFPFIYSKITSKSFQSHFLLVTSFYQTTFALSANRRLTCSAP